jgi:hypothetical protein
VEEKQVEKLVQQVKAEEKLVPKEPEESEEEVEEVVTVGVLNLGAKEAKQVKAPEPSALSVPSEERQTTSDLKTDPSAVFFTPAETLEIVIHKAAIKASLSRQMSERNIGVIVGVIASVSHHCYGHHPHHPHAHYPGDPLALTAHTDLSTGHHHPAIDAASYSAGHSYTNMPPGKKILIQLFRFT